MKGKSALSFFLFLFAGIVLGGFLGDLLGGYPAFSWLAYGKTFGLDAVTLNLSILTLTFGFTVNVNIASLVGICIAVFIYRKL